MRRKVRAKHTGKIHYGTPDGDGVFIFFCDGLRGLEGTEQPQAEVSCLQCIWKDVKEFEDNECTK